LLPRLLKLQQERRALHLHHVVDVLESSLHQSELRLDRVVSEGDRLSDCLFGRTGEFQGQELDEFVFDVLDEVQLSHAVSPHDEDCKEAVGFLDTAIEHLVGDGWELVEVNCQLLDFLEVSEVLVVHTTTGRLNNGLILHCGVVEEEVIF
jgi:hypothetical protein